MLLVLDIGNSNVTACAVRDGALGGVRRSGTDVTATADQMELLLDGMLRLDGHRLDEIAAIACVSVVPALTDALARVAEGRLIPFRLATAGQLPLPVRVDRPSEVGGDRLVNALAAHRLYGSPAVVADLGTALTVDAVARDGGFLGGAIAAGPALGLHALASHTAQLPTGVARGAGARDRPRHRRARCGRAPSTAGATSSAASSPGSGPS